MTQGTLETNYIPQNTRAFKRGPSAHERTIRWLNQCDLEGAKIGFSARRVDFALARKLISGSVRPRTGDLLLAEIERVRYQVRLELPSGRKANFQRGDRIIVAYGDRYATDQFESVVPLTLEMTNLVATGGVASDMLSCTQGLKPATIIRPVGLLGDVTGRPLNLRQFRLPSMELPSARPPIFAVLGTSMNSGKTTINRFLATGLSRSGYRVGTAKITGTASGGDFWAMLDAGAHTVVDFTDAGYSATYKVPLTELLDVMRDLVAHLCAEQCDVILIEVADGIFQEQNRELIEADRFHDVINGVFFAAGDSLGAAVGVAQLQMLKLPVLGVSGKLTISELLMRETRPVCPVPIYTKEQLADPMLAPGILALPPRPVPRYPVREVIAVEQKALAGTTLAQAYSGADA